MTIDHTACEAFKTDIDMMMAAAGVRGQVLSTDAGDALDSTVRNRHAVASGNIRQSRAAARRASRRHAPAPDDRRRTRVQRRRWHADPDHRGGRGATTRATPRRASGSKSARDSPTRAPAISIEGKVRTLVAHDEDAYEEWGASFAVRVDPGSDGRGLSLSITPTWGSAGERNRAALVDPAPAEDLVGNAEFEAEQRLDAELGYGVRGPGGWGTLTPFGGLTLADGAGRTLRTGLRWTASQSATVGLEATREDGTGEAPGNHALMLRAAVRW